MTQALITSPCAIDRSQLPFLARLTRLTLAAFGILLMESQAVSAHQQSATNSVYLFTSFHGNGEDGLRFLYSLDGYHWTNVPGTFLKPQVGPSRLMRDPSLVRADDGTYHLVWTTGWHTD